MKITIDTVYKTISVQDTIRLEDLMEDVKKLLPNGVWKEYSLVSANSYMYTYPYVTPNYPVTYGDGIITTSTSTSNQ